MEINTNDPVHDFTIFYRITAKDDPYCNFMDDFDIEVDVEICGYEQVIVQEEHKIIEVSKTFNIDRNSKLYNISDYFSLTTPNECPIIKYELWTSTR